MFPTYTKIGWVAEDDLVNLLMILYPKCVKEPIRIFKQCIRNLNTIPKQTITQFSVWTKMEPGFYQSYCLRSN